MGAFIDEPVNKAETLKEEGYQTIFGRFRTEIKWKNVVGMALLHLSAIIIGFTLPYRKCWKLILFNFVFGWAAGFGVTAGAHRLWTHRSYKANTALRIILILLFCVATQNSLFDWVRNHRVHHKYSETDADPHNSKRGLFFSHVGWLLMKKHPDVKKKGKSIDMSDILNDPVVQFQQRYYLYLVAVFGFILPSVIPVLLWKESLFWSMAINIARLVLILNITWLTNSIAHAWGSKPYDKKIAASDVWYTSLYSNGELWHNYHHTFPWDYKAAELGNYSLNSTAFWIDQFAKIGWAYDLKQASKELIEKTAASNGDGSHAYY